MVHRLNVENIPRIVPDTQMVHRLNVEKLWLKSQAWPGGWNLKPEVPSEIVVKTF